MAGAAATSESCARRSPGPPSLGCCVPPAPDIAAAGSPEASDSVLNDPDRRVALRLNAELGFLGVLDHRLQLGRQGTYVDLRRDVGQDTLFVFGRVSSDLDIGRFPQALGGVPLPAAEPEDPGGHRARPPDRGRDDRRRDADRLPLRLSVLAGELPVRLPRRGSTKWRSAAACRSATLGSSTPRRTAACSGRHATSVRFRLVKFRGRGFVRGNFLARRRDRWVLRADPVPQWRPHRRRGAPSWTRRCAPAWPGGGASIRSSTSATSPAVHRAPPVDQNPFSDGFNRNWLHFMSLSVGVSLR